MLPRTAVAVLLLALPVYARVHKSANWVDSQFGSSQRMQQTLQTHPVEQRTRLEYQRVINAYRRIYLAAPSSSKAAPSVVASAQLLEEMGRRFDDDAILRSAIGEYEFLRREYPGSKSRFDALFRIGEIYRDDLHDKAKADAVFQEFVRRYPRNPLAAEARKALTEPVQQAGLRSKDADKQADASEKDSVEEDTAQGDSLKQTHAEVETEAGKLARVTGIRHWSTPEYTRVAIDLEQGVKYQAQRIENPDRVFFDLYGTRLDRALAGKSFDVDDGFLKKIRISQFKTGRTRVVLDLDELTDYDASFQKNPPRLIIEVHNRDLHNQRTAKTPPAKEAAAAKETLAVKPAEDISQPNDEPKQSAEQSGSTPDQDASQDPSSDTPTVKAGKKPAVLKGCVSANDNSELPAACSAVAEAGAAKADVQKPSGRRTVVTSNGVKKTIVDGDDDDDGTVAKLDPPEIKPASKAPSVAPPARSPGNSTSKSKRRSATEGLDIHEAQPTASGDRSLIRALDLKIGKIVIDPGHGGHDTGTIGPNGLEEKDLVLDVSRRLGKLLVTRLGAQVVYTRKDDTFIPLEDRTAIANREGADLFVSVHANSSHDPDARGVETYYLNFTSSPDALEVAARENAVSEKSIHELQDLVKKIALKEKIEESHEFASDVQNALHGGLAAKNPGLRDRGVKKAPFIVLIGANMPSILAEISFVSNPGDEHRLETAEYRQRIAESLYRGIAKYVSGLSGVKVASKIDKEGQ